MNDNIKIMCIVPIILAIVVGLYFIVPKVQGVYNTYNSVQQKTQEIEQMKKEVEDLRAKKEAYDRQEKTASKPVFKSDLSSADQMASFGVMFEDVIQSAKYNGLKLRSIAYNTNPVADVVKQNVADSFNVCEVKMQLIGNYNQLRSYFEDIYNYPYLINIDKITIFPYAANKSILIADVAVVLYSEMNDAQKAAYAAAKALENQGDEAVEGSGAAAALGH